MSDPKMTPTEALALVAQLRDGITPGPWGWFGNASYRPSVYLATRHSGRRYVMDFVRWGFNGAQPRFQPARGGMVDAKDPLQFEVGDQSIRGVDAAKADGSVYRLDVRGIDSPDARLIAAAPALLDAIEALARALAEADASKGRLIDQRDHAESMADKLAHAIGGDAVGEHSNLNCPWTNALEIAAEADHRARVLAQLEGQA